MVSLVSASVDYSSSTMVGLSSSMLAAYAGCVLVKRCAGLAYSKHKRSTLASDLVAHLDEVVTTMFDD